MSTRMLLYFLGLCDGPSCKMPRRLLLLRTPPWTRNSWYARFLLHRHALTTSCRREPSSLRLRHVCFRVLHCSHREREHPASQRDFLVPRRAISLAKQFLEASLDVVALQETRTRLAGTIRLPGHTATSTDAGPEAYYGAQLWIGTHASERGAHDRTAFRHESLVVLLEDPRILAVSATATAGQKLHMVTFNAPHAQRPHTEINAWWTRFGELVATWKLPFSNITLLGDTKGRVGSDLSIAVGPVAAEEQNNTSLVWHLVLFSCLLATMHNVPVLDRLHRQCVDLANFRWENKTPRRLHCVA